MLYRKSDRDEGIGNRIGKEVSITNKEDTEWDEQGPVRLKEEEDQGVEANLPERHGCQVTALRLKSQRRVRIKFWQLDAQETWAGSKRECQENTRENADDANETSELKDP